ncbi:hypothetical protein WJX75_003299 [Coccomyxa subellipsoidea]|uniref:PPM-type phosphatase domain-containing protein n=1 Tax=Coccomyxa subellipsoidea TaxID=248742 RepID=A0ABR2YXA9_9CHLO
MLGRISSEGAVTSVALSVDHIPDLASEAARIRALGGRLEPYTIGGEQMGPTRVWLADKDTPGLSMTRAFGDTVASSVGVIAQPHVMEIALEPEHQYLVLCSDGIYEFMSNDEIVGLVHAEAEKGALPAQIAELLVRTARHQWMAEEDGGVDDCTAIVCFLTRGNLKPGAITPAPLPAAGVSRPSISRHVACHMHRSKHHL